MSNIESLRFQHKILNDKMSNAIQQLNIETDSIHKKIFHLQSITSIIIFGVMTLFFSLNWNVSIIDKISLVVITVIVIIIALYSIKKKYQNELKIATEFNEKIMNSRSKFLDLGILIEKTEILNPDFLIRASLYLFDVQLYHEQCMTILLFEKWDEIKNIIKKDDKVKIKQAIDVRKEMLKSNLQNFDVDKYNLDLTKKELDYLRRELFSHIEDIDKVKNKLNPSQPIKH